MDSVIRRRLALLLLVLAFAVPSERFGVSITSVVEGQAPGSAPLLQQTDLVYEGAFRLPLPQSGENTFAYGAMAMTVNPARSSLFLTGHVWYNRTAEIAIPAIRQSPDLAGLARATLLQPWTDATEGRASGGRLYGQWVHGGSLFGAVYSTSSAPSHFRSSLDLSVTGDVQGLYRVGTLDPRFYAGYMAAIPGEWQASLRGVGVTGGCCNPGQNGATSLGPAAFAFDPAAVGTVTPVPVIPLVYYTSEHPTLGTWGNRTTVNPDYNLMTEVVGAVFPPLTRSVIFFGRTGMGVPCYGNGTNDPAQHGQPWAEGGPGAVYCYDPNEVNGGFGPHAYPYSYYAWAYDALELSAVAAGTRNPWDVTPYSTWAFDLPFQDSHRHIQGATFDAATGRIYLSQAGGDADGIPLIHVFRVNTTSQTPPGAPSNLRIITP